MKRKSNSTRSVKWLKRNSLGNPSCERYVRCLIENHFEFDIYEINETDSTNKVLRITYGCFSYIIETDDNDICLKVLEKNTNTEKDKYHLLKKKFYGDACWYNCLDWIKTRQIIEIVKG